MTSFCEISKKSGTMDHGIRASMKQTGNMDDRFHMIFVDNTTITIRCCAAVASAAVSSAAAAASAVAATASAPFHETPLYQGERELVDGGAAVEQARWENLMP